LVLIYGKPIKDWKCVYKDCGALCCKSGREITAGDIKRISEKFDLAPEEFVDLEDNKGLFKLKGDGDKCMFLNKDHSCKLYKEKVEPIFCEIFPFELDGIIYSDEIMLKIKQVEECPGFGRGEGANTEFEAKIERLGNQFIQEIKDYLRYKGEGLSFEEIIERI